MLAANCFKSVFNAIKCPTVPVGKLFRINEEEDTALFPPTWPGKLSFGSILLGYMGIGSLQLRTVSEWGPSG